MHKPIIIFLFCCLFLHTNAQKKKEKEPAMNIRQYFFVLLTKGPNRNQDSATASVIMKGHLGNMQKMYEEGKLKVAGPFDGDEDWQGIFIFDCNNQTEVEALLKTDPAIKAGRLNYTIKAWYTEPSGNFKPGKPIKK